MTKQIDTLLTNSSDNKSLSSTTTTNKEVKQEASLFDKLLSNNTQNVKVNEEKSANSKNEVISEKKEINTTKTSDKNETIKTSDEAQNKTLFQDDSNKTTSNSSNSLLDRLVLEAKKNTQTNTNLENNQKTEDKSKNDITVKDEIVETRNKKEVVLQKTSDAVKVQEPLDLKPEIKNPQANSQSQQTSFPVNSNSNETVLNSNLEIKNKNEKVSNESSQNIKTITEKVENTDNIKNSLINNDEQKVVKKDEVTLDSKAVQAIDENTNETIKKDVKNSELNNTQIKTLINVNEANNTQTSKKLNSNENQVQTVLKQTDEKINIDKISNENIALNKENIALKTANNKDETTTVKAFENNKIQVPEMKKEAALNSDETFEVKNNKVAKELNELNNNLIKNEKINVPKDEPKSLMDNMIEKLKNSKNQTVVQEDEVSILKNSDFTTKENNSKSIISNIYLSSQQNSINNNALSNKTEAINAVKSAISIEDIELNAEKLDLNVKNISLENTVNQTNNTGLIDRKNTLDKLMLNNNARHNEVSSLLTKKAQVDIVTSSTNIVNEDEQVALNVSTSLAQNIETRIISARQQLSSMMSEVARRMYENYKPPITAFKINLNPAALGNIAIIMKSDSSNGINISLNISNTATLDAFVDNQNTLRNALNKTFEENTVFNLDFSSSEQNQNNSNNQEDSNNAFANESDTQTILESRQKNLESEDSNLDYM